MTKKSAKTAKAKTGTARKASTGTNSGKFAKKIAKSKTIAMATNQRKTRIGPSPKGKAAALARAWDGMGLLNWELTWDEVHGEAQDVETVQTGLEALASALSDFFQTAADQAAPLDQVLAQLGEEQALGDDSMVENAARLIDILGRARYGQGVSESDVAEAEPLREELALRIDGLLNSLDTGGDGHE